MYLSYRGSPHARFAHWTVCGEISSFLTTSDPGDMVAERQRSANIVVAPLRCRRLATCPPRLARWKPDVRRWQGEGCATDRAVCDRERRSWRYELREVSPTRPTAPCR